MASSNNSLGQQTIGDVTTLSHAQSFVGSARNVYFGNREQPSDSTKGGRDALFLTHPQVDRESLRSVKGDRVEGTCEWIKDNEMFKSWLAGDMPLLWVSGGPGKGKTMISIFLTEDLEHDPGLVYYFCTHADNKRGNAVGVLRSLLWQITTKQPELGEHLKGYLDTSYQTEETLSSKEALWLMLEKICRDARLTSLTCVLDGLDECDVPSRDWLSKKLPTLFRQKVTPVAVKLIIVSREILALQRLIKDARIKLDPDNDTNIRSDIERFIENRVSELEYLDDFSPEVGERVKEEMLRRSEGTFLWVGFAMSELLEKNNCLEVQEALRRLPSGLPAIYKRMLFAIRPEKRALISNLFQWVALADDRMTVEKVSLALDCKPESVRSLIAMSKPFLVIVKASDEDPESKDPESEHSESEHPESEHSESEHPESEEFVAFIHQSAKDFLLDPTQQEDGALQNVLFGPEKGHARIASTCLSKMCIFFKQSDFSEDIDQDTLRDSVKKDFLMEYAVHGWYEHFQEAGEHAVPLVEAHIEFFEEESEVRELCNLAMNWAPGKGGTALHLASFLNILPLARDLLLRAKKHKNASEFEEYLNKQDSRGKSALTMAAWANGSDTGVLQLLLSYKARVNDGEGSRGGTALHRAARGKASTAVELLLQSKAAVDARDAEGRTALHHAARNGDVRSMRCLLGHGADVSAVNLSGQTPLHFCESLECMKLLLDHGAQINARDNHGETPLHEASRNERDTTIRLLLDSGADVNTRDNNGKTPLYAACTYGQDTVACLLLDSGTDVNANDNHGETPLHVATQFGRETTIRVLLDTGADVNCGTNLAWTPLMIAAQNRGPDVVRMLLDSGADVNGRSDDFLTPLLGAVYGGKQNVVRVLLNSGADITATSNRGTALQAAVKRLREVGQYVPRQDLEAVEPYLEEYQESCIIARLLAEAEKAAGLPLSVEADLMPDEEQEQKVSREMRRRASQVTVSSLPEILVRELPRRVGMRSRK